MPLSALIERLSRTIGLDPESIGSNTIASSVRQRMSNCDESSEPAYTQRVEENSDELQALIEAVVVPETWFFRDGEPFEYLEKHIADEWKEDPRGHRLRILSVPCATGEEPYSIAMSLRNAGMKSSDYSIDAVDISHGLLRKAEAAVFGANSFRGNALGFRDRYFDVTENGYLLRSSVRSGVRFLQGNIISDDFLAKEHPYDIIFCRNLLIYCRVDARQCIIRSLSRLLREGGLLFVGHAEMMPALATIFTPVAEAGAFAYCKIPPRSSPAVATVSSPRPERPKSAPSSRSPSNRQPHKTAVTTARVHIPKAPAEDPLEHANRLADAGKLQEAAAACEGFLKSNSQDVRAHVLLGVLQEAMSRRRQAEESFNRALYLDPSCYEAIMHLSLLKERRGDIKGAELLKKRAARIHDKQKEPRQ